MAYLHLFRIACIIIVAKGMYRPFPEYFNSLDFGFTVGCERFSRCIFRISASVDLFPFLYDTFSRISGYSDINQKVSFHVEIVLLSKKEK